jgi:hypothetical protein
MMDEFPDGKKKFRVIADESLSDIKSHGIGWAMDVYGSSRSREGVIYYKSCLGV